MLLSKRCLSLRSRFSPNSTRMFLISDHRLQSQFKERLDLFSGHRGKTFQKVVEPIAGFQMVDEGTHRDSGSGKHRDSAQDFDIA